MAEKNNRNNEFDFAVIGGGLVGAAIAWGLASARPRVAMLDEGDIARRAARANFALVWVQGKGLGAPAYGMWTLRAAESWPAFADMLLVQTGIDVRYRRPGGFHLALSESELERRAILLASIEAQPGMPRYGTEMLDSAALRRVLPEIGPEVVGGSFSPMDGDCDSLRALRAMHAGFQASGGTYMPGRRVASLVPGKDEFRIATAAGEIRAARIVLAAGLDNERLGPMVGLHVPVRPQRGQVMVTERAERFLNYPVSTLRQTEEGSIMIGDSHEESDEPLTTTAVLAAMADRARRMFPCIARLNVVRAWAALRVMPRDGFPIYDQSREFPGAFVASAHSGVTLAPNHALVLAPHLVRGELPAESFRAFTTRRFDVPQAA